MVSQDKLTILQYNMRKSRKEVMIPLFENEQIKEVDIIARQEPWQNPWKHTTYHPLKSFLTWYMRMERIPVFASISIKL